MSQKIAPGKWDADKRQDAKGLLIKLGAGCLLAGAALIYVLAVPALQRGDLGMWDAIVALAPGGILILGGLLALIPDLLPFAYHIVDRVGKDAPEDEE